MSDKVSKKRRKGEEEAFQQLSAALISKTFKPNSFLGQCELRMSMNDLPSHSGVFKITVYIS